jgi:predicted lipoprotein with Yx(FWY)xxD motif
MRSKSFLVIAALGVSFTALAGCSGADTATPTTSSSAPAPPPAATPSASASASASTSGADLGVIDSELGEVIVDSKQMTAYIYTKDVKDSGKSTCTGDCLKAWPPIVTESDTPTVEGITGTVGTIDIPGGKKQITVNGLPIYTWFKDKKPGDVTGQDVGGVWYVLGPDGEQIRTKLKS